MHYLISEYNRLASLYWGESINLTFSELLARHLEEWRYVNANHETVSHYPSTFEAWLAWHIDGFQAELDTSGNGQSK